jgi:hypothetical protein
MIKGFRMYTPCSRLAARTWKIFYGREVTCCSLVTFVSFKVNRRQAREGALGHVVKVVRI